MKVLHENRETFRVELQEPVGNGKEAEAGKVKKNWSKRSLEILSKTRNLLAIRRDASETGFRHSYQA